MGMGFVNYLDRMTADSTPSWFISGYTVIWEDCKAALVFVVVVWKDFSQEGGIAGWFPSFSAPCPTA